MEKERKILNGFILFEDENCNFDEIIKNLKEDWEIEIDKSEIKDDVLVFEIDGMRGSLAFIKSPVPNKEAEENAKNNFLWQGGVEKVSKHKSQMIVATFGENPIETGKLFVKLSSSVLKLENTIGIYKAPTVMAREEFLSHTQYLKEEKELPIQSIVYIGLYRTKKGIGGYTDGLKFFDKKEIEILDSKKEAFDIYDFIFDIIYYVVGNNVELKDGETIGFSVHQKLPITISKGVAFEEDTIKIKF
ncbi:DUF4261 domain-containing protein [Fusobacterium perfoetens]|uniref:DUF4261 domain-containing protein n=1 Tax=Fusobacterium perfoetens TaxID=852 RepID=UPI00056C7AC9|nr:DUF4261 domain-containing protein [Fusobacterium perfoetens]MCI6152276.1 DUF4261 domain-containing protein [Fusobacterium perfoetens]MDY3238134.1 DUF4261 domain-containing protein [Fusobacterium perfoetens]